MINLRKNILQGRKFPKNTVKKTSGLLNLNQTTREKGSSFQTAGKISRPFWYRNLSHHHGIFLYNEGSCKKPYSVHYFTTIVNLTFEFGCWWVLSFKFIITICHIFEPPPQYILWRNSVQKFIWRTIVNRNIFLSIRNMRKVIPCLFPVWGITCWKSRSTRTVLIWLWTR